MENIVEKEQNTKRKIIDQEVDQWKKVLKKSFKTNLNKNKLENDYINKCCRCVKIRKAIKYLSVMMVVWITILVTKIAFCFIDKGIVWAILYITALIPVIVG